jgi:hypothetical protein
MNKERKSLAEQLRERPIEFPTGYYDCCGMSKAVGHAEFCPLLQSNELPLEGC